MARSLLSVPYRRHQRSRLGLPAGLPTGLPACHSESKTKSQHQLSTTHIVRFNLITLLHMQLVNGCLVHLLLAMIPYIASSSQCAVCQLSRHDDQTCTKQVCTCVHLPVHMHFHYNSTAQHTSLMRVWGKLEPYLQNVRRQRRAFSTMQATAFAKARISHHRTTMLTCDRLSAHMQPPQLGPRCSASDSMQVRMAHSVSVVVLRNSWYVAHVHLRSLGRWIGMAVQNNWIPVDIQPHSSRHDV